MKPLAPASPVLFAALTAGMALVFACASRTPERVSRFGEYRGYSEARYDGYERRSDTLPLADGTQLAYDLLLPTRDGVPSAERLPVLLIHTPYLRALKVVDRGEFLGADLFDLNWLARTYLRLRAGLMEDGHLLDQAFRVPWLRNLIEHGYVVVAVERSGTGASSGRVRPSFEIAAREADEILDWIAAQPWSNGRVGMFGHSYEAMTQYAAASTGNPHLEAIFPCSSNFDFYSGILYPGGIFNTGFTSVLARATPVLETMVVPVDGDPDEAVLARTLKDREQWTLGRASGESFEAAPYRDGIRTGGERLWDELSLYRLLDRINRSGVAVYNSNGWQDLFTRDVFLWHANLEVPRRLHVRPLHHRDMGSSASDLDFGAEAHRWFDYWLKDIDNGIMDEDPIHYYVEGARPENAWRTSRAWPLVEERTRMYLAQGRSGSVRSTNDGGLHPQPPSVADGFDDYTIDFSTSTGKGSRWNILADGGYPDMRPNDEKALTYTSPPLADDVEITGHPVAHLWILSDAPDADFFVTLEEVDPEGSSMYATEGILRASHRLLSDAPFRNLGLPYHRSYRTDLRPIPAGEPVELVFDLQPISRLFRRGNRIRVAITGADLDNFDTPIRVPAPTIRLLRNADHASFVALPILPSRSEDSSADAID